MVSVFCSDDHLYVFHDELIADESHIVLDEDDQEGVLRLGPTEAPEIQRMRVELNNLNYAQVGCTTLLTTGFFSAEKIV